MHDKLMRSKIKNLFSVGVLLCTQAHAAPVSFWNMTPEEVRTRINQRIMAIDAATPTVGTVENKELGFGDRTTQIRIYTPIQGNHFPVLLLIHGGAWVAGNLDTHDHLARYLCSKTPAIVVSVGYLNAPEGKFPFPLEQCYDVLTWIAKNRGEFSSTQSGLTVIGDSAGGNMAAALCLMARDRSGPLIDLQVLINPAPDLTCSGTLLRQGDALDNLRWQAFQYLKDPKDTNHPYVSPLKATDLSNLPPALILVAEHDDLRVAGEHFGNRLQSAGVATQIYCQKGTNHLAGDGARASAKAEESLNVAIGAIQTVFSQVDTQMTNHRSLAEQFKQAGYVEICDTKHGTATFDALYAYFDELIAFLQIHPVWAQKLYAAKERFIRSKERNYYSTDFFGFYDESKREGRDQISFYYSTHFHEFICSRYPEFNQVPEIIRFFTACREIQKPCGHLFDEAATNLGLETLFSSKYGHPPILFKVIKYFPAYVAARPHFDGTAFSLFLDSTDNESLLLSPYKSSFTQEDFSSPQREFTRERNQNSTLLIPGVLLTEFSIYPTPHIVAQSGQIRYAAIAFAMRPNYTPQKAEYSPLPNFKH